jgi:hypothetical protein
MILNMTIILLLNEEEETRKGSRFLWREQVS